MAGAFGSRARLLSAPSFRSPRILEQLAHLQQDTLLEGCLRRILASPLQRLVQRLIEPGRVRSGVALEVTLCEEVQDEVMLGRVAVERRHQGEVAGIEGEGLLGFRGNLRRELYR